MNFSGARLFGGFGPGLTDIHFFLTKNSGGSHGGFGISQQHMNGFIYLSGNQTRMIPRLRLTRLNDTMSFPLYYLTIYDTLYERNLGLLSIMNSGRALDE